METVNLNSSQILLLIGGILLVSLLAFFFRILLLGFFFLFRRTKKKLSLPTTETEFKGLKVSKPASDGAAPETAAPALKVTEAAHAQLAKEISEIKIPAKSAPPQPSWWNALSKTREKFFRFSGGDVQALRESLEEACLISDLGVANTQDALNALNWEEIKSATDADRALVAKRKLAQVIQPWIQSASTEQSAWLDNLESKNAGPKVIWFVGVNGGGKTTSIAKLASELKGRGKSVVLAAGDTFRAAASEQLEIWAQRLQIECVRGQSGADSSAVIFDAIEKAKAKNFDYVLCDSAGRLHNQSQLMEALKKNRRVIEKALPGAPHEVLLVLDANTGQNMLIQAEQFISAVGVTGLILTKLDGTARGGAVIAVARKTSLPIRRLGLGESATDFVAFNASKFSEALLGMTEG